MDFFKKNKKIFSAFLIGVFIVGGFFVFFEKASAQITSYSIEDFGASVGLVTVDLKTLVINIIKWVLGIVSLAAVSLLIYGGVLWMTSRGNEEKIAKAKKVIINTLIGMVIIILAWAIVLMVERFVSDSTGENVCCTPGDISSNQCYVCGSSCNWLPRSIPPAPASCVGISGLINFHVNNVETSHDDSDYVYMCSRIQPIFNNNVESTTVDDSVTSGRLYIENTNTGDVKAGTWTTLGNTINFEHPKVCSNDNTQNCTDDSECGGVSDTCDLMVFDADTEYEINLPDTIEDRDGLELNALFSSVLGTAVSCGENNGDLLCEFTTNDDIDTVMPYITSTYPVNDSDGGYPDRNVDRVPIIEVNFSESIDATTVFDLANPTQLNSSNIILEQLDGPMPGASVVLEVDPAILEVSIKENGFDLMPLDNLEPFTWYQVTVQNIEDLCGNPMESSLVWQFQTNDKVAGFASWYPTGSNVCPDTDLIVVFNTSMYKNDVTISVGGGTLILPSVETTGNTSRTDTLGTLRVIDVGDPVSTHYKVFELDIANDLSLNTTYLVDVVTDKVIDSEGGTLEGIPLWDFYVTSPEDCACDPYITNLSPDRGGRGECITVNGRCFTGTSDKRATPNDVWFVSATGGDISGGINNNSYGDNYIVTTFPDSPADFSVGDFVPVKTSITYDDSNYGTIASNEDVTFDYNTDEEANGPCLSSVNPDYGYISTDVRLEGIRFEPSDSTRNVTFDSGTLNVDTITSWSDTRINTNVPDAGTEVDDGLVNVRNNAGTSNGIPFDIREYPPGVPFIIDFWPNCEAACINTLPGARFNIEMDSSTISDTNITLAACVDSNCAFSELLGLGIGTDYNPATWTVTLEPDDYLTADSWYRVTIADAVLSDEGEAIGNLNYDADEDGTNDSFSWVFKTKDDDTLCSLSSVDVSPETRTVGVDQLVDYRAYAYGSPDECDPSGQMLVASSYNWTWDSSDTGSATITNNDSDENLGVDPLQRARARAETPAVQIRASAEGYQDYGTLTITEDPTFCVTDEDCSENELGEACPGSVCLDNRCTPVINGFSPMDGAAGTWVSVAGCWFGNYIDGKSQVLFDTDKVGEELPGYCGPSTWLNYRILREVPDDVASDSQEEIAVQGGDSSDYNYLIYSSNQFTVNTVERPGICALNPNSGLEGITLVRVRGKNFGDSKEANDRVFFHNGVEVTQYSSWADTTVLTTVPVRAQTGDVYLVNNLIESNLWPFTVQPPNCRLCTTDLNCTNIDPNQGCGSDGCCYDRPTIFSSIPDNGDTDVCLNTAIRINFSQPMNQSTINTNTIDLAYIITPGSPPTLGHIDLTGKLRVTSQAVDIILDELLNPNTEYRIYFHPTQITSTKAVSLNTAPTIIFTTADTNGACEINKIIIEPSYHMFTDSVSPLQNFIAHALDSRGLYLTSITDVYSWTWVWSSLDDTIVRVTNSITDIELATALKNGRTRIKVVADALIGWEGNKEAYAGIEVAFCDMPWFYEDSTSCNPEVGGCNNYNFELSYCQGNYGICEGSNDVCTSDYQSPCLTDDCCPNVGQACEFSSAVLPNLDLQAIRGQSGDVLKQYLFKESGRCTEGTAWCTSDLGCPSGACEQTSDGIGIRIYANPSNLSPSDWYQENIENAGSPQSMTVDGYQAVRDGRTIYVAATNYVPATGGNPAALFTNIYLISYNDSADSNTIKVYNRLVENWHFNTNLDFSEKEPIARDLIRLSGLAKITGYLNNHRLNKTASESVNLLQNPGFENGIEIPPDNWTAGPSGNFSIDSGEKYEGDHSVHIIGGSSEIRWLVQNIPVTMGKVYEVTAWLKANTAEDVPVRLLTQCMLLDGTTFDWDSEECQLNGNENVDNSISGNSGWVKRTEYVYANRADRLLRIGCSLGRMSQNTSNLDESWCDNFSVRETDAPYPSLEAGSYIPNMSFSKWPSWQATLGNALGKSLPVDPLNILIGCPSSFTEQGACWDEVDKKFFCGSGSYIYAYKTNHGMDYILYTNLETDNTYWTEASTTDINICSDPSHCECFDYSVSSP